MPAAALSLAPAAILADTGGGKCILPDGNTGVVTQYQGVTSTTCCPPQQTSSISCLYGKYLTPAVELLSALAGIVIVGAIIFGAIEYITSGGDPQRAQSGKKRITEALIGLVAFLLLYAFLQFIIPGGLTSNG